MIESGYMQSRWYQQSSHGMKRVDLRVEEAAARCDGRDDERRPTARSPRASGGACRADRGRRRAREHAITRRSATSTCPSTPRLERANSRRASSARTVSAAGMAELVRRARLKIG